MGHHLMEKFVFCPICGSSLFMDKSFKSRCCQECGFEMFVNPAASVVCFIISDSKVLVARRAFEPEKGALDFPGGFVDPGESLEEAVVREMKEETHLNVVSYQWLFSFPNKYFYSGIEVPTTDNFFLCKVSDLSLLHAEDDVAELIWIPLKDLQPEDMAFVSMQNAVRKLKKLHLEK